jgi:hypothetical protein
MMGIKLPRHIAKLPMIFKSETKRNETRKLNRHACYGPRLAFVSAKSLGKFHKD